MELSLALQGSLQKTLKEEADAIQRAALEAVRSASKEGQRTLRKHYADRNLKELGFRWKSKLYSKDPARLPLAIIYTKGDRSKEIVYAFEHGDTIPAKNGRYLWIPTQFNRHQGRRGRNARAGAAIVKPGEIVGGFVRQGRKPGTLVLYAPIENRQREHKKIKGRMIDQAYVNKHLLAGGRAQRTRQIMKYGAVPMFSLIKQTRITKRTDLDGMARIVVRDFEQDFLTALAKELGE